MMIVANFLSATMQQLVKENKCTLYADGVSIWKHLTFNKWKANVFYILVWH